MSEPWRLALAAVLALGLHGAVLILIRMDLRQTLPAPLMMERITVSLGGTGASLPTEKKKEREKGKEKIQPVTEDTPERQAAEEAVARETEKVKVPEARSEPEPGPQPGERTEKKVERQKTKSTVITEREEKPESRQTIQPRRTRKRIVSQGREKAVREDLAAGAGPVTFPRQSTAEDATDDQAAPQAALVTVQATPLYRVNPPPRYPRLARRRGLEGTVLLEVLVDRNGRVREVRVQASSGHPILDRAAFKGVRNWRFSPGTIDGQPSDMWIRVPVRFQLR